MSQFQNPNPSESVAHTDDLAELSLPHEVALQRIAKELLRFERGEQRSLEHLVELLGLLQEDDYQHLAKITEIYLIRGLHLPPTAVSHWSAFALYNCIYALDAHGFQERAELMCEQLLPLAERSGSQDLVAWLHKDLGLIYQKAELEQEAGAHFSAAYQLIKERPERFSLNALPIYNYFALQALKDEALQFGAAVVLDELRKWCGKIQQVLDHPQNKHPLTAGHVNAIAALEFLAEVSAKLEETSQATTEETITAYQRLVFHAMHNSGPLCFPTALVRMAEEYGRRCQIDDCLAESVYALEVVGRMGGAEAEVLRKRASDSVHIICAWLRDQGSPEDWNEA